MEAAGRIRLTIEAKISPGPPILNLRRHGNSSRWDELGVFVANGNFLAAKGGVQRVHILDCILCGALFLELLTGDGVGTMVTSDVYEGTLMGRLEDIPGIKHVIRPLEESGALIQRSNEQLLKALDSFIVVERDGSIIACAALFPFFEEKCGELAAVT